MRDICIWNETPPYRQKKILVYCASIDQLTYIRQFIARRYETTDKNKLYCLLFLILRR